MIGFDPLFYEFMAKVVVISVVWWAFMFWFR